MALFFTGIHVGSLILDTYVHFGLVEVLVPFTGTWHPAAVAWGVIGLYLLLAVELTSLARKRLSKRVWRMTHYLSFPLFFLTTVHALSAGTDRKTFLLLLTIAVATAMVTILTFVRLGKAERRAERSTVGAGRVPSRINANNAEFVATRSAQERSQV
jgi:DMSO/TMAO reductase YedYZ heme-binding membrane subunit